MPVTLMGYPNSGEATASCRLALPVLALCCRQAVLLALLRALLQALQALQAQQWLARRVSLLRPEVSRVLLP